MKLRLVLLRLICLTRWLACRRLIRVFILITTIIRCTLTRRVHTLGLQSFTRVSLRVLSTATVWNSLMRMIMPLVKFATTFRMMALSHVRRLITPRLCIGRVPHRCIGMRLPTMMLTEVCCQMGLRAVLALRVILSLVRMRSLGMRFLAIRLLRFS